MYISAQTPESDPGTPEIPEIDPEVISVLDIPELISKDSDLDPEISQDLDNDILSALGETTSGEKPYGEKIHDQIFGTIKNILVEGLPKQNKDKLLESFLIPSNCKLLDAPKLNTELLGVLNDQAKTRDKLLQERQQEMGLAIGNICHVLDKLSKKEMDKITIIKNLSEVARVLSIQHFQYTEIRRKLITPFLDKNLSESLKENKRDLHLYTNLDDSVKSFSAIKRTSNVLKPKTQPKSSQPKNLQAFPRRPTPNQPHPTRGRARGRPQNHYQPRHPYIPQNTNYVRPSLRGRARYP